MALTDELEGLAADQQRSRVATGELLDARREVDAVAEYTALQSFRPADRAEANRSRVDADTESDGYLTNGAAGLVVALERGQHRQGRVDRVARRTVEEGHDRVADVTVDESAMVVNRWLQRPEEVVEEPDRGVGRHPLDELRISVHVGEQD